MSFTSITTQRVVPTTGQTVTISNADGPVEFIIDPATSLGSLTVVLPTNLYDGLAVRIMSTAAITAVTVNGSVTIVGSILGILSNNSVLYVYSTSNNKWYKFT